jgi:hypothetical protein
VLAGAITILDMDRSGVLPWIIALGVAAWRIWRADDHPLVLIGLGATIFTVARVFA